MFEKLYFVYETLTKWVLIVYPLLQVNLKLISLLKCHLSSLHGCSIFIFYRCELGTLLCCSFHSHVEGRERSQCRSVQVQSYDKLFRDCHVPDRYLYKSGSRITCGTACVILVYVKIACRVHFLQRLGIPAQLKSTWRQHKEFMSKCIQFKLDHTHSLYEKAPL